MKTKLIKGKVDILLVDGLPKEARDFKYFNDKENPYMSYKLGVVVEREYAFPQGKWKYINTLEKLTEDEADGLVDRVAQHYIMYGYTNIMGCWTDTALKSFQSLLEANDVLSRNQFERPNTRDYGSKDLENDNSRYWKLEDKWREAEAKVFNKKTTLIFKKE